MKTHLLTTDSKSSQLDHKPRHKSHPLARSGFDPMKVNYEDVVGGISRSAAGRHSRGELVASLLVYSDTVQWGRILQEMQCQ